MSAAAEIFRFEMSLLPPYRAMTKRGLRVDNPLRLKRIEALEARRLELLEECQDVLYDVWDSLKRPDLFLTERRCGCCGGGSIQAAHCWRCAGLPKKPERKPDWPKGYVRDVAEAYGVAKPTVGDLRRFLPACVKCEGQGKHFSIELNPDSAPQLGDVLYNGLRLPPRYKDKKLTTDEEALQSLMALDSSGLVERALRYRKCVTMREIYERLEPDPRDSCVRSVFNPAGTYTNRPSSAGAFYVPYSTNLLNITEEEAQRDPLYAVRDIIVPSEGEVLMYADLSGAEARVVAALSEDAFLLEQWERDPFWSPHRWTASKIFGVPESEIDKKSPLYFLGKQSRHAFNYGEGPNKFWRVINSKADVTGVAITLQQARECFLGYHRLHPTLDSVWWNRVEERIKRDSFLTNTFGFRCNFYPRFDPETGELNADTLRAAIAWEPQSTIGMLANMALRDLWARERGSGFRLLLETYDGVMVGVDKYRTQSVARALKAAMERSIVVNGKTLLIPAEVFVCRERWSESERVL